MQTCRRAIVGVVVVWLAGAAGCGSEPASVAPAGPRVTVSKPIQRSVTDYLNVTGSVVAIETVEIRARVQGFLDRREFTEGEFVEQGELLYVIDPREFEARLQRAEASKRTAEAAVALQTATLKRREQAARTGAVSELEVIESRAKLDGAEANLQSAEAEIRKAKLDLSYTAIRAPITGRVGESRVDLGNLVGASEPTLLTTIVRYDPINLYFSISERDLLRMADGAEREPEEDRATRIEGVRIEAARSVDEGYPFEGTLDLTDQGVDRETGTLMLRAVFPNPEPVQLVPGLFVRARVPLRERDAVLLVPERALGADQSGRYLLVAGEDDVVEYRSVTTGALVDGLRVIDEGIDANDRVITNGVLFARPGSKVTPEEAGAEAGSGETGSAAS